MPRPRIRKVDREEKMISLISEPICGNQRHAHRIIPAEFRIPEYRANGIPMLFQPAYQLLPKQGGRGNASGEQSLRQSGFLSSSFQHPGDSARQKIIDFPGQVLPRIIPIFQPSLNLAFRPAQMAIRSPY